MSLLTLLTSGRRFTGILDTYTGATAAYSLRKLRKDYTGSAIRVRKTSSNAEQNIGFDGSGNLDTASLLAFIQSPHALYTSNFSSGVDSFSSFGGCTITGNETVGGVSQALKSTSDNTTGVHRFRRIGSGTVLTPGYNFTVTVEVYIPSTNAGCNGFRLGTNAGGDGTTSSITLDTWHTVTLNITNCLGTGVLFDMLDDGATSYTGVTGDAVYIKNLVTTQTTADGDIVTWYDQIGSANVTEATAANQPIIVSNNVLEVLGTKPAAYFPGVSQKLAVSATPFTAGGFTIAAVRRLANAASGNTIFDASTNGTFASGVGVRLDNLSSAANFSATGGTSTIANTVTASTQIQTGIKTSTDRILRLNGSAVDTDVVAGNIDVTGVTALKIGACTSGTNQAAYTNFMNGRIQEVLIWNSDKSADIAAIEANMNTYWGAY